MPEITYYPEVECGTRPGLIEGEVTVSIADATGNTHFLRVPAEFVHEYGEKTYLPVGIVEIDRGGRKTLVELPHEADSGFNRLWIPFSSFRYEVKDYDSFRQGDRVGAR